MIDESCPYGRVCVSFEVMPLKIAESAKVGKGRDEPNSDPYLPPPIGRMQWTWNPYTLIVIIFYFFKFYLVSIYST